MEVLQRPLFQVYKSKETEDLWKTFRKSLGFLYSKASPSP